MHRHRPVLLLAFLASVATGCAADDPEAAGDDTTMVDAGTGEGEGEPGDAAAGDTDGDGIANADDNCPALANPEKVDGDGDGVGDACDCAPNDPKLAAEVVVKDAIANDKLAPAKGFAPANWAVRDGALHHTVTEGKPGIGAMFLQHPTPLGDVVVEATLAPVAGPARADALRQALLLARGASKMAPAPGTFSALGCGIEILAMGEKPDKTSALVLGGNPKGVATVKNARKDRAPLAADQETVVRMVVRGDTITCTSTVGMKVTTTTLPVPPDAPAMGQVGLLAGEMSARFKKLKVCAFRD